VSEEKTPISSVIKHFNADSEVYLIVSATPNGLGVAYQGSDEQIKAMLEAAKNATKT